MISLSRITIKNNSTSVALSYTITSTGTETALKAVDAAHTGYAALVSGTTMTGDAAYVSSFAEITSNGAWLRPLLDGSGAWFLSNRAGSGARLGPLIDGSGAGLEPLQTGNSAKQSIM